MRKISLLCVILVIFAVGCGKEKKKSGIKDSKTKTKVSKVKKLASADIPVLSKSEDFLGDDDISNFAFVDDEKPAATKASKEKESVPETALASRDISPAESAFIDDNISEDVAQPEVNTPEEILASNEEEQLPGYLFKTVHFNLNKNDIRADQVGALEEDRSLAQKAVQDGKKVVVHGHCCQLGSYSYNLALSERRANTVKDELVKSGIPSDAIKTVGFGSELPLVWSDKTDRASLIKELAPNRRAELVVN
jgi:outer membrane protein OmpA-like peptidoglycan-associated protein